MIKRIALKSGCEFDILTKARRLYTYAKRPGVAKGIKKQYNKRFRKTLKSMMKEQL